MLPRSRRFQIGVNRRCQAQLFFATLNHFSLSAIKGSCSWPRPR